MVKENNEYVLKATGLTKHYGPICALDNVDFELKDGEILGLLGDNGAGKSTLIKIISGAIIANKGNIEFEGKKVSIKEPNDAIDLGIETIYQDLALFDNLNFTENIYAGRELVGKGINKVFGFADSRRMRKQALEKISNISINLPDLDQKIETLSGGQRQAVALTRSIFWSKKIIIMDEPTAALGVQESRKVLNLIKETINHVNGIILITHNIEHVIQVANRIIVLRHGKRVGEIDCLKQKDDQNKLHNNIVQLITGAV